MNALKLSFACLLTATSLSVPAGAQTTLEPVVQVESGVLRAAQPSAGGVLAFKGIPYAAPPVANLRWHAPQPALHWQGERDASRFGNRCLSALQNDPEARPPRTEDCLTLNVWTGAHAATEKRPVMV